MFLLSLLIDVICDTSRQDTDDKYPSKAFAFQATADTGTYQSHATVNVCFTLFTHTDMHIIYPFYLNTGISKGDPLGVHTQKFSGQVF